MLLYCRLGNINGIRLTKKSRTGDQHGLWDSALVWSNIWKIRCVKQKMELVVVVVVVVVLYKLRGNENT